MTQKYEYDSKLKAEKNNRVGMAVRLGAKDAVTGKRPAESLHIITASTVKREYNCGEPVWVATVELRPGTPEEIGAARKRDLSAERSALIPLIAADGWNSTNVVTREWIARVEAITAEIGQ